MNILRKPIVVDKLRRFQRGLAANGGRIGRLPRVIEFVYDNRCNFKCQHCSTAAPRGENAKENISLEGVRSIADQAHEIGFYEFNIYGGEILIHGRKVFDLIEAVGPERFYTYITTNGYLMTRQLAKDLASAGLDRVSISLDSSIPEEHDRFRGKQGAHGRAIEALAAVKEAGMQPFLNITVGHYNAFSEDVEKLLAFSKENGYTTFVNVAVPIGCWNDKQDVMIDERDRARLIELRKKYGNVLRDLWDPFDKDKEKSLGCQTLSKLHITPSGDVTACSFLHIKIGNVLETPLKDILDHGYRIKYFGGHVDHCIAGEDREFAEKFLAGKDFSMMRPLVADELFGPSDYLEQ